MSKMSLWFPVLLMFCQALSASDALPVEVLPPVRRDMVEWIRLPGNTDANVEVSIFSRATGVLKDFKLDVGDLVKPGQLIGTLDAPDLEQEIKQAESQVLYAKAEIASAEAQEARVKARALEIDAKQATAIAEKGQAHAAVALAQKQYERTKRLFDTNAATDEERETKELTVEVQNAAETMAGSKIESIKADREALKFDIAAAEAVVQAAKSKYAVAESALQRAKINLNFTSISVPQLGLSKPASSASVMRRYVSNGDLISGGTSGGRSGQMPLISLVVLDPIRVIADVPEAESSEIHEGTPAQIEFTAFGNEAPAKGTIARISPVFSANTRSMHVEIDVPNPNNRLRAGMMAYSEIQTAVHKDVLAVPNTAIQTSKLGSVVFTVEGGKAVRHAVKCGFVEHGWTEISGENLSDKTPVVKDAQNGITDGAEVEITTPAQAAATR